jgi:hypothetical protein
MKENKPPPWEEYQRLKRRWFRLTSILFYILMVDALLIILIPDGWHGARNGAIALTLLSCAAALLHQALNGSRFFLARHRLGLKIAPWTDQFKDKNVDTGAE